MIFHILFNYNQSSYIMDEKIQKVLEEKIRESISAKDEIITLVNRLGTDDERDMFPVMWNDVLAYGIIVGRLYNSFYYQSRRILKRDPNQQEFNEFIKLLGEHRNELSDI